MQSDLLNTWLGAVNQPVVDGLELTIAGLLLDVSDNGNFSMGQCKSILTEIINDNSDTEDESPFCQLCGSCGESGCCRPDMCKLVQCKYGPSNLRDYTLTCKQWDVMNTALERIKNGESAPHLIAEFALQEVDALFSMT